MAAGRASATTGADGRADASRSGQTGDDRAEGRRRPATVALGRPRRSTVTEHGARADAGGAGAGRGAPTPPRRSGASAASAAASASRASAPRATLRGSVAPDPSGLRAVKLSITRSVGGRCQLYSSSQERFRHSRCGRRVNFSIGDRQDWSYLLPSGSARGATCST